MTTIQHKPDNPIAHLTAEDIEKLGRELDAIRDEVHRQPRRARRRLHPQGHHGPAQAGAGQPRACCCSRCFPPAWLVGTAGLSVAKILENMEIGHNVLHGQWDWMRDPKIHSTTWEWDHASPAEQWKHSHNELHHTYTNVLGKDNDLGYGIMRVDEDQQWHPLLPRPAAVELRQRLLLRVRHRRLRPRARQATCARARHKTPSSAAAAAQASAARSAGRCSRTTSSTRCCPARRSSRTLAANLTANLVRNLWTHSVIMCGHFPEGVETFEQDRRSRARPAASGTCGRCSARPTSAAAG